jgi:hypothetical protein
VEFDAGIPNSETVSIDLPILPNNGRDFEEAVKFEFEDPNGPKESHAGHGPSQFYQ